MCLSLLGCHQLDVLAYCWFLSSGTIAREEMVKSKLPNSVLRRIWALSDIDKDGMLDKDEFAVAMFLIDHKLSGNDIPEVLPERMIPPSKRMQFQGDHFQGGGEYRRDEPAPSYSRGETVYSFVIVPYCG